MSSRFNVDQIVIDLLASADALATDSAGASAVAIVALARDVSEKSFKHGEAKTLTDTLVENGLKVAAAKRAAEVSAQLVNAAHHVNQVARATARTRSAAIAAGNKAWITFWAQAGECSSVQALRTLAKKHSPKADNADKADNANNADKADIIQGAPVANDPAQEKAVALEGYKTALAAALKAGISPDTLKALILAEGKAKAKAAEGKAKALILAEGKAKAKAAEGKAKAKAAEGKAKAKALLKAG